MRLKDRILLILQRVPETRDNDIKLYIVLLGIYKVDPKEITALKLLSDINNGHLPQFESCRRARQKLQEDFPELRGKSYIQRQRKANEYRKNIEAML